MINFFMSLSPVFQALIAGFFTFSITTLGAAIVFFFKSVNKTLMDAMLSLSAGIMLAASFFSLLNPAIEIAGELGLTTWAVVFGGIMVGGILLYVGDKVLDLVSKKRNGEENSNHFSLNRCAMLFTSITLHNIPDDCSCYVSR